jgi:hypothetical protein
LVDIQIKWQMELIYLSTMESTFPQRTANKVTYLYSLYCFERKCFVSGATPLDSV